MGELRDHTGSPVEETPQEHYEDARSQALRCLKCGSTNRYASDYYGDAIVAMTCRDCGFDSADCGSQPYVAPGEPGSHDKPEDYDPWEGE